MKTYFDCIPCFIRQTLDSVRMITEDEKVHEEVLRWILCQIGEMNFNQSPPAMAQEIHRFIREIADVEDPYFEVKNHSNKLALEMYPELRERVEESANPLETAIRLAIAGNIIDFGVTSTVERGQIERTIAESLTGELDMEALERFRDATSRARSILYLGDNAGEIVFDRLLIEQLPCENMTFVVKGGPVLNDAVMEDAQIVGLTDIVKVIDNGSDAPGTILESCSEAFRHQFDESDLIIAKGQGNYETLSDTDKEVYFLVKPKCVVLARNLGCEIGSLVLTGLNQRDVIERS